jgi:large subunit ribosomal protein L24
MRIRKNDTVLVISGKDKGKTGNVIAILPKKDILLVDGIAISKCHIKARKPGEVSSIKERESYVSLSKVMPVCSSCKKPCRVSFKVLETGKKTRVCSGCKQII